jgi:uncharacterized DUF497 family protein
MFEKFVQRGRSERRGEAYSASYVEPLSDARTKLADYFNILLLVVYTVQETEHEKEKFRIISARQASRRERQAYARLAD